MDAGVFGPSPKAWRGAAVCLAMAASLAACAETGPEMKMSPAASAGVGVRFSRGEAVMVSAGERGAVAIRPVRYNGDSGRVLFIVAGYNRSSVPINFGPENLTIRLDDGSSLPVYDFDGLRHGAKLDAERAQALALVEAAANAYSAYRVGRRHPEEGRAALSEAADLYQDRLYSIGDNLTRRVATAQSVLQTTTVDPGTYWVGWIVADQPQLAAAQVRAMKVDVGFAGEAHRFNLTLAPEGAPVATPVSLPAVSRADGETMLYRTPSTWLWDAPPPAAPSDERSWTIGRF